MKLVLLISLILLAGCATPRVLVREPTCKPAGPGLANCEKVMDL